MAQKMCILPVRCVRCSALFDLWYDLREQEEARQMGVWGSEMNQSLCWSCRQEQVAESEDEDASETYEMEIELG